MPSKCPRRASSGTGSHRKEDGSEVTEIDLAVEESVRNELARHMPEDGIYGEEKGSTAGMSGRRWIIDPINGTTRLV
ncbi:hypothetical protein OHB41_47525 [Streptomyces sp. NBC_01571]|uniref:inositol monophosphatase family protein n=1 Tax=Streptomyces sp. NBC_01571 TaxID=2975883 RepID=UPI00224E3977|nr:inositol monophosphatase family protein [Streptomyces sp. NBC_01571]MCX4580650.1 hypothetical protein [Streptomyces sp. NBC_01571]